MAEAIQELQDSGVEPDLWKVEGLARPEDCGRVVTAARAGGCHNVGCIVLGRGADNRQVGGWLEIATVVLGFVGFAIGQHGLLGSAGRLAKRTSHARSEVAEISRR